MVFVYGVCVYGSTVGGYDVWVGMLCVGLWLGVWYVLGYGVDEGMLCGGYGCGGYVHGGMVCIHVYGYMCYCEPAWLTSGVFPCDYPSYVLRHLNLEFAR